MHRFLGFNLAQVLHPSAAVFLDMCLLVLLLCLWRPAAVLLIYLELLVRAACRLTWLLVCEFYIMCVPFTLPISGDTSSHLLLLLSSCFYFCKVILFGSKVKQNNSLQPLIGIFRCLSSFSLLVKIIPKRPKRESFKNGHHKELENISFVYRFVKHFI